MSISEIAAVLQKAGVDMEMLAARIGDLDFPDEVVLPFISNFLTDRALRDLKVQKVMESTALKGEFATRENSTPPYRIHTVN